MKKNVIIIILLLLSSVCFAQENTELQKKIREKIEEIKPELIEIRRQIHENPELGNREFKTAALVAEKLRKYGIEYKDKIAHTGVVGILKGDNDGRVVAVRGDMDALPIQEQNDLPYISKVDGVMHACGHDVHTTVNLGTAIILSKMMEELNGTVKFIFQPAEEGSPERGGADLMIDEGVLENPAPEVIFGLHTSTAMDPGYFGYVPGGALAAVDRFEIVVKGVGTHGAYPWTGKDPIVAAAHVITALQNIRSRMTDTRLPLVVTVGTIHGGTAFNIIPEEVKLVGTIRTHDMGLRDEVHEMIKQITEGICSGLGCTADVSVRKGGPVTYNNPELSAWSEQVLKNVFGENNVFQDIPAMGGEDFAYYSQKIPGFFYWLGSGNREKGWTAFPHNPKFIIDEESIVKGVEAQVNLVLNFLNSSKTYK